MHKYLAGCLLILASLITSATQATVIIYATESPPAPPSNMNKEVAPGSTGFFDVFIRTDVPLNGVSLDIDMVGPANQFTGVTVQNPLNGANARWTGGQVPTVAANGLSISDIEGYALAPNPGLNPANAASDPGYDPLINAFHFARINYNFIGPFGGVSQIKFSIGANEIGSTQDTEIFLGTGDAAACNTANFDCGGATSALADGVLFIGIPEPAAVTLVLTLLLTGSLTRKRRSWLS